MKTRFLIIIAIVAVGSASAIIVAETYRGQIEWKEKVGGLTQEKQTGYPSIERLLTNNNVNFDPDTFVVEGGFTFGSGDTGCGAVMDNESNVHWFKVDSISNPTNITLYVENPNKCRVNYGSCFCNAQMSFAAKTLDKLSYFNSTEQKFVEDTVRVFLSRINMAPGPEKFVVGKYNFKIEPDDISFCGAYVSEKMKEYYPEQLLRENVVKVDYFRGIIRDEIRVLDFQGGARDDLCAINENASVIHFERDTTLHDSQ